MQVSATQFSLFLCMPFVFMATDRASEDAQCALHCLVRRRLSSNVGSLNGSGHDLDGMASRSTDEQLKESRELLTLLVPLARSVANFEYHIQTISPTLRSFSHPGLPTLNRSSILCLPKWPQSQKWNRITAPSLHACLQRFRLCKILERLWSKWWLHSRRAPWSLDHLMTTETRDEDLILRQVPKMSNHGVPFYFDSIVNNTSKELQSGSIPFGWILYANLQQTNKNSLQGRLRVSQACFWTRGKCQDFVAQYKDDGISFAINSPFCRTSTTITVRQSRSIEDREIGKQFAPLWREMVDQLKVLFPDGDDEGAFIIPALDARSHVRSIKDRKKRNWKTCFKLFFFACIDGFYAWRPLIRGFFSAWIMFIFQGRFSWWLWYLAFSSPLCVFVAIQLFWCRTLCQWGMLISHVLRRSWSEMPLAFQ